MTEEQRTLGSDHQRKDDAVFRFFRGVMDDIQTLFRTDEQGHPQTSQRAQLVLVYTFIDVTASFWYAYLGKVGTPSGRFISWVESYALTKRNGDYSGTDFEKVSPERLYSLRCSMVHFFGIARKDNEIDVGFAVNNTSAAELEKWRAAWRRSGRDVVILTPWQLYVLVLEGVILMLDEWKGVIDLAQTDEEQKWAHIRGIDRVFRKIDTEGAAVIR